MDVLLIRKLDTIFNGKKWDGKDGYQIVFDKFCKLLSNLSEIQRSLILELAERYMWISFSEYNGQLIKTLQKIENIKLKSLKRIMLFPIMKPENEGKFNSGKEVLYAVYALRPLLRGYEHITFKRIETFKEITADSFTINNNEAIFLLDDYLGSGETIKATLNEIKKNRSIKPNNLYVISIAAQKESLNYLNELGYTVYTEHLLQKGISDYYSPPILEEKTKIMLEIEKWVFA